MAVKGTVSMAKQLEGAVQKVHTVVGVATDDYNVLKNKPVINGVELVGTISLSDLGLSYSDGLSIYTVKNPSDGADVIRVSEGTVDTKGRNIRTGDLFLTADGKVYVAGESVIIDGVTYFDAELFTDLENRDYEQLSNKPRINGVELSGDVSSDSLGITAGGGTSFYTVPVTAGDAETIKVSEETVNTYGNTINFGDVFLTQDKKLYVAATRNLFGGYTAELFADLS